MRILLINYRYFISGGPEQYMFNVKDILEKAGHEVIPFSVKSQRNMLSEYEKYFADPMGGQDEAYYDNARRTPRFVWDVIARLFYSFHVKKRLDTLIEETRPDVAYILHHYNKLSPSVIDACKNKGLKVYVRLSDFFLLCPQAHFLRDGRPCERCLEKGLYQAISGRCVKGSLMGSLLKATALFIHKRILFCYRRVDGYVCTTQFMRQKMQKGGWPESKLHVIPTFIRKTNNAQYDCVPLPLNGRKYILYFGRFTYEKGLDLLLNAYAKTGLSSSGIELVLAGGKLEELHQIVEPHVKSSEFCKNIHVFDFLPADQLSRIIQHAMYVVVPSRWYENLPNTVLEAYSHGKPVIAMNIGSMAEIIEDGISGLLFNLEDASDLAKKLELMCYNAKYLSKLSRNASSLAEKYRSELHLDKLLKLIK